jgi:YidC/Oxa1 family membrane protein insertase
MQSQTRNWFLFFGLFFALMLGHTWLRNKIWPPPPKLTPQAAVALDEASRLISAYSGAGLVDAYRLTIQATASPGAVREYADAVRAAKEKAILAAKAEPAKPVDPPKFQPKPEVVTLGGDGYLLTVKFTTEGAAVQQLILNPFPEVNSMGLGAKNADGSLKPLELIPEGLVPSFAIYHYAIADPLPSNERPLDTLGKRVWTVLGRGKGDKDQSISFTTDLPEQGVRLTKTYTVRQREFHVGLTVRIERLPDAKGSGPFRYQLAGGRGLPIEGEWYTTVFRNTLVGWVDDKGGIDRVQDDNRALNHTGGSDRYPRGERQIQYGAVAIQYFISAIVTDDQQSNRKFIEYARATVEDRPDPKKPFLDDVTIRTIAEAVDPKPGEPIEHKYLLYHGPIKVRLLSQLHGDIDPELIQRYETTLHMNSFTDYGKFGFWTEVIVFFTNVVHAVIGFLRNIMPAGYDALCIMLVTVLVRGMMFPVSRKQAATMARTQEQMAKIQPEMKKIKEKFKGDVMAQQQAMSELYRRHGVNPAAGLGGCLMVFLQMPVFLGLYFALQESFLFRLKRFIWAPNLTAPDMLFWWSEKIPFISDPSSQGGFFYLGPYFNLLPVVAIALMFVQQKLMTPPAMDDQAKMQQTMMKYMMILFCFMFYKVPAGLSLYFICSTLWGVAERKLLPKKKPASGPSGSANGAVLGDKPTPGPRGKFKPKPEEPGKLRAWWDNLLKEASKK